jgi:hypothetical protein
MAIGALLSSRSVGAPWRCATGATQNLYHNATLFDLKCLRG